MRKELFYENRRRILFTAAALLVIFVVLATFQGVRYVVAQQNDHAVETKIAGLSYTEDAAREELASLQLLAERHPMSDANRGHLYRAMAEISYMAGNDMVYNQYVSYAMYYLERVGDEEAIVYLNNKYIGRLYANGCYRSARKVLADLEEKYRAGTLSPEMTASYYLSSADVAQMLGRDSKQFLANAQKAIEAMEQGGNRSLNQAKHDLLTARNHIQKKEFASAAAILNGYSESDDFGLGENQVYVVCDFQIPYYELKTKISLKEQKFAEAYQYADNYLDACDYYEFRAMKLRMLEYIVANTEGQDTIDAEKYRVLEKKASQDNLNEMTDQYGEFLLYGIDAAAENLQEMDEEKMQSEQGIRVFILIVCGLLLLYCIGSIIMDYASKDGLTRLNSRKKYEQARTFCERRHVPHCLLMLDIDDFKKVNDTFGHDYGDVVLRRISDILRKYSGRGISVYRYGGEELCMMFLNMPEKRCREIAEEIRRAVEDTVGKPDYRITISGGVGVSQAGEDVLQAADRKLYEAKGNGKNQIR